MDPGEMKFVAVLALLALFTRNAAFWIAPIPPARTLVPGGGR